MPGVELGDYTIVAAGAVVTNDFTNGYCILGGLPVCIIKELNRNSVIEYKNKTAYKGYVRVQIPNKM